LPLWLAVLLKKQKRLNIVPPPWLEVNALSTILDDENKHVESFSQPAPSKAVSGLQDASPPFTISSTADAYAGALPYYWLEMGELLLDAAADDVQDPDTVRRLLKDLREVRMAKMRAGVTVLAGSGAIGLRGVGNVEVGEGRTFITGVIDNLRCVLIYDFAEFNRAIGASREKDEQAIQEQEQDFDEDEDIGVQPFSDEMDL
jgi:GINS complex subunit 2